MPHVCHLDPWPECLRRSFANLSQEVYRRFFGASEFHVTGTLRTWDITSRLPEIGLPTLVLSGRHDEATPEIMSDVHRGIGGSVWTVFEESAHLPHLEEPELFLTAVRSFLRQADSIAGSAV